MTTRLAIASLTPRGIGPQLRGPAWPRTALLILGALAQGPAMAAATESPAPAAVIREIRPLSVRGTNYYPSLTPWDTCWTATPDAVFESDLALAARLNVNTVRVFLPWTEKTEADGLVTPDGVVAPAYLARFETFLSLAWRHGLRRLRPRAPSAGGGVPDCP